jgi:MoxR-like ATPase
MFLMDVDYPTREEEERIVRQTTGGAPAAVTPAMTTQAILEYQELVRRVPVPPHVVEFAVNLVRATRPQEPGAPPEVKEWVSFGAGPRASQNLVLGAKARAVLQGRFAASVDDVRVLARPILVHRVMVNFRAEASGKTSADVIERVLALAK